VELEKSEITAPLNTLSLVLYEHGVRVFPPCVFPFPQRPEAQSIISPGHLSTASCVQPGREQS